MFYGYRPRGHARSDRPRDTQRQRIYDAECFAPSGRRFESVQEMQDYVDRLRASAWFKRHWDRPAITVKDGRGSSRAHAHGVSAIAMPRGMRTELILLHEVAHCTAPQQAAAHGPEFARVFLELVRHKMGEEAASRLREGYRAKRVRVGPPTPVRYVVVRMFGENLIDGLAPAKRKA